MKRTIRLTESELTRMITECVKSSINVNKKKALKEGTHRYKGFKCVNISRDPSFPSYQVISPEGEAIGSTLFPSEMKTMVDDYLAGNNWEEKVYKKLDENVEYDDYASISEALVQCGWAYTDSFEVVNRNTGQHGMRYIIEPYPNNPDGVKPMNVEEMKAKMTEFIGPDNVLFSEGQHRQAPEIKNLSIVVFE